MTRSRSLYTYLASLLFATTVWGQIPAAITYQGVLQDDSGALQPGDPVSLRFWIFVDKSAGTYIYEELHSITDGSIPDTLGANGAFTSIIGSQGDLTVLEFDKPYYLEIAVWSGAGWVAMKPRTVLTSVPYAIVAGRAFAADTAAFALTAAGVDSVTFAFDADTADFAWDADWADSTDFAWEAYEVAGGANTFPSSGTVHLGTAIFPNLEIVSDSVMGISLTNSSNGFRLGALIGFPEAGGGGALALRDDIDSLTLVLRGYTLGKTQAYFTGGNVGFGTPGAQLRIHVMAAEADVTGRQIRIENVQPGGRIFDLQVGATGADENQVPPGGFSIYDATSGVARLVIDAVGNVGIGTVTPNAKLEVAGSIIATSLDVTGSLTANSLLLPGQKRYYSIPAVEFTSMSGISSVDSTEYYLYSPDSFFRTKVVAPVHFPHGALISAIRISYYDNEFSGGDSSDFTVNFYEIDPGIAPRAILTEFVTTVAGATANTHEETITGTTVDNSKFSYIVTVMWKPYSFSTLKNLRFYNVRITYTITEPLP
ncbi:MAG: hypothetical protein IIA59_01310 [Candidatus Marinimicrobia bacterium]|nr:hypothetical protein [Candidatus Neomarinimicrobiota bacterium]